jgi:eukaryotic-like serine/threonine-protein kinase
MARRSEDEDTRPSGGQKFASRDRFSAGNTIGRGGQATVRRVRDRKLDRDVAMKVLNKELANHADEISRFIDEARITAGLQHPHVPAVHDLGTDDGGDHYFTMKLVEGETLAALLAPPRFDPADDAHLYRALQILMKVCEAVSFAHSKGVIHCDLKPANVMVGSHGQIYVMDWGISRRLKQKGAGNEILGTVGYMSPEQARGENATLDPRTDVYSLGAMLYRIVVGFPPYHAQSGEQGLDLAKTGTVFPPEKQARGRPMSRRLLDIALKALSAKRDKRQRSVDAFVGDLESYLRGASRFPEKTYERGEVIINEGDEADCAFLIRAGRVEASRKVRGKKKVLREMGVGEVFGEAAILDVQPRTATVRALEETRVSVLSKSSLADEMGRADVLALALTSVLRRFYELEEQTRT